jgi:hypothetical protein
MELRSIQVRPDFVHGRSVRFTRYLFEQQSSPSSVEVTALTRVHDSLREQVRVKVEHRTSQPSAPLIDSQSVRAADDRWAGQPRL